MIWYNICIKKRRKSKLRGNIMREFNEEITKKDIEEIYEALTKFDSYISYITRNKLFKE